MDERNESAPGAGEVWPAAYQALGEYAASHDSIKMTKTSMSVPAVLREEFYDLVKQAQKQLCSAVLADGLDYANSLSASVAGVVSEIEDACGLESFVLGPSMDEFLEDPLYALSKPGFSFVLNGLQRGADCNEVIADARSDIEAFSRVLLRSAYEAWVYYGVVAALSPVKFYDVYSPDTVTVFAAQTKEVVAAKQVTSTDRRIPEAAFETADGRIFAMKSEASTELDYYGGSKPFRDNSAGGNTAGLLTHRVLLLYRFGGLDQIAPIIDKQNHIQRPSDLMVEVLEPDDFRIPAFISTFVDRANGLKSKLPVQVVTRTDEADFPEGMQEDETVAPVCRRVAGFSESVLAQIASLVA